MYKTIVGMLIFLSALFAGTQAPVLAPKAALLFSMPADLPVPDPDEVTPPALAPEGVRVSYNGTNGYQLHFLIYNGSPETLTCYGFQGVCATYELRINDLESPVVAFCTRGLSRYEIKPGQTAQLNVEPYPFRRLPGKNDTLTVGFKPAGTTTNTPYYAAPLPIPAAVRKEIRKYLSDHPD